MRNRTELVTTTLPVDSDNEEEGSIDDSEEDWQPEKKAGRGGASKVSPKNAKRKSSRGRPSGGGSAKKSKKESDSEEDEEDEDQEDEEEEDELSEYEDGDGDGDGDSDDKSTKKSQKDSTPKRGRASTNVGKNQPDKDGNMELYLFKNDLTKEFRNDPKLCMWRRDGASLLQKYLVVKNEDESPEIYFNASSVYSCWEEKRKNDFFQIKVTLVGEKKDGKVKVIDLEEFEKFAAEDRPQVDLTPKGADDPNATADDDDDDDEEDQEDMDGEEEEE